MSLKSNLAFITIALIMTSVMWLMPETISSENHKQRLLSSPYDSYTNPTRTAAVGKYCAGVSDRTQLISNDKISTSQQYKAQLAKQFTINGNTLINKLVGGNQSGAIADVQSNQTAFGLFIGFFIVGFILLIIVWPFLICCCCCPSCCPSKCCQKNQNEQYTKCELYWPTIVLILCLLLIVVACALGLSKASGFKDGLNDTSCAVSMMFDDIINGNVTQDQTKYFIGVTQLIAGINNLGNKMTNISGNITQLTGASMTTAQSDAGTARTNVDKIPTGVAAAGNATISYTTQFNLTYSASNPTINSILPQILGSSGNGGVVGGIYTTMDTLKSTIDSIISSSSSFSGSSATFSSSIGSITSSLSSFQDTLNNLDNSVNSGLSSTDSVKTTGTMVIQLFYGVALGFACLALLGVILMTFCDKYKCRYLMYFSCVILFFFGLIGFIIAVIFSIIVPFMYWGCDWMSVTIGSSAGFDTNLAPVITDAQTRGYVGPCLPGGTGDLMNAVAPSSATTLANLKTSISNTSSFNTTAQTALMDSAITNISSYIDNFYKGNTPDITDTNALATLVAISDSSNFACATMNTDSWIVSAGNTSFTSCHTATTPYTAAGCTTRGNIQGNAAACQGCIDSTAIFNLIYSGLGTGVWKSDLSAKYSTACSTFTDYYGNVWDNYYRVKIPAFTGINTRWTTAKTSINTVKTDMTNIKTTMDNVIGNLTAAVDGIVNPQYGLIAGLNCLLIGEDLNIVVQSICVSNFNTIYITRLVMGISSFGILFALCCIVCSGVRHYKHAERKDKISPSFMDGKHSFEDTDAAFRP